MISIKVIKNGWISKRNNLFENTFWNSGSTDPSLPVEPPMGYRLYKKKADLCSFQHNKLSDGFLAEDDEPEGDGKGDVDEEVAGTQVVVPCEEAFLSIDVVAAPETQALLHRRTLCQIRLSALREPLPLLQT